MKIPLRYRLGREIESYTLCVANQSWCRENSPISDEKTLFFDEKVAKRERNRRKSTIFEGFASQTGGLTFSEAIAFEEGPTGDAWMGL